MHSVVSVCYLKVVTVAAFLATLLKQDCSSALTSASLCVCVRDFVFLFKKSSQRVRVLLSSRFTAGHSSLLTDSF